MRLTTYQLPARVKICLKIVIYYFPTACPSITCTMCSSSDIINLANYDFPVRVKIYIFTSLFIDCCTTTSLFRCTCLHVQCGVVRTKSIMRISTFQRGFSYILTLTFIDCCSTACLFRCTCLYMHPEYAE